MSTETVPIQNIVVRCPEDLLAEIDAFVAARGGGSRHATLLFLWREGMKSVNEKQRDVHRVVTKLAQRITKDVDAAVAETVP
jgi:metal-responsive CopG/Arc/MetJ family transcriptional regulator